MKRNLMAMILCLLALLVLPAKAEAAEAPGIEILAPAEVPAGETVTVTVALTGYDASQDAILGMQVDVEYPESLTPVSQTSHLSDDARSNLTLARPEENLVRLLYIQEEKTLPGDTWEVFTAVFGTAEDLETATVPVTVRFQMESGAQLTLNSVYTLQGKPAGVKILRQPENSQAALNERYCVTVEAQGEGLTYQWYFRNKGSDNFYKSSVRDNTYDDVMTTARAGREVYCVITDAYGNTVTTDTVRLIGTVSEELAIVKQPVNGEAHLGENYCVTVEAKGEGLKYRWYLRNAGSETFSVSSVTDNTYDDVMTTARAGREIYCVITDALGNQVTTDTVKLVCVPRELTIVKQPENSTAKLGEEYCSEVLAEGDGLKYQWYFCNKNTEKFYRSSVRDNTYNNVMTGIRHDRKIYCVITDVWGNSVTTNTVRLIGTVSEELAIVKQPVNGEAHLGENYCVTVEAKGEGLKYRWYLRNAGSKTFSVSSVTDNTYDDVMTTARAGREIYCVITDALGNQVTTDTVKLVCVPRELTIVKQPEDSAAAMNEDYCVEVLAEGDGLKYQWYFKNRNTDNWYRSSVRDNTYDDVMTAARAGREVYCVITDTWGNTVTTETAALILK